LEGVGDTTMPANLTPEYKAAEAAFRKARDPRERLESLREMLRVIPKHKGTDHLQGDIKRRIKELAEELERPKRGGAHGGPALVIRPEGAAQIPLLGPPNAGKSSLHARLTGSGAQVAPYPFATQYPQPGMMPHEGIHFQLVDLPAVRPNTRYCGSRARCKRRTPACSSWISATRSASSKSRPSMPSYATGA
jgi:ribosome-interacting GTPase 1